MSQLNPLGPLDFDYERFPGVALRATDAALAGHALIDRPKQVFELIKRIGQLVAHIAKLMVSGGWLDSSADHPDVQAELSALNDVVSVLETLPLADFLQPALGVQKLADSAGTAFGALLDLLLVLLDEWQSPTSLESYRELFENGTIPPPQALMDFLDGSRDRNQVFASWWVQGNNPLCVSGVTLADIEQAVGPLDKNKYALVMPGDTPRAADAEKRLFWVDFPTLLAGLEPGDFPVRKRLPKPRVLFAVKPTRPVDEPFVPLAIFDDAKPKPKLVWSDAASPATANDWTRAMLASLCANQLHHTFVSHFPRTHFVMEAVAVATLRTLDRGHSLFWLLRTHIDGTLGFNETALDSFVAQAGADRFLMAGSLRTGQMLMRRSLDGWKDFDFPNDIARRQVDPSRLPYYPYRDDAQLWWDAIGTFADNVIDAAYADDAAVMSDKQLQAWARVLVGKRTRAENGAELIATAPTTKVGLWALLRKMIFTCTAYHAVVQIPLNGFDVSPLTAPCAVYPDDAADPPESMLADFGTSLFQLVFFYFGDVITERVGTYAENIPGSMQDAVRKFEVAIEDIGGRIDAANSNRQKAGAYETLLPNTVSRSVDI